MNSPSSLSNAFRATDQSKRLLLATGVISLILWYIPYAQFALYPLRLFVTFVHEACHAVVTILTGGRVAEIQVLQNSSGWTLSEGGIPSLICSAGYVGTAIWGAIILQVSKNANTGNRGLGSIGAFILAITLLWVRPWGEGLFGFIVGIGIAMLLFGLAKTLDKKAAAFALSFLSVQLSLNALLDLRTLLFLTTQTNIKNDAVFMVNYAGMAPWFWSFLWAGIAAITLFRSVVTYWKK